MSQSDRAKALDWKQQGSKDIKVIEGHVVRFPMSFERCERPRWVSGYCQKCNGELGDIVWLAHSTPFCKWEMDWAYGEFIYCDSCGLKVLEEDTGKTLIDRASVNDGAGL